MAFPSSSVVPSASTDDESSPRTGYLHDEIQEYIYLSIENFQQSQLQMESHQKEKQISVDPISLKESSVVPTVAVSNKQVAARYPPPLPPLRTKPKFLSCSLPNSATPSPRSGSNLLTKKLKNQCLFSPSRFGHGIFLEKDDNQLWRSKSCGEGRASAPSDEFELSIRRATSLENRSMYFQSQRKIDQPDKRNNRVENRNSFSDEFKCGSFCLFIPAFGKGKPVKSSSRREERTMLTAISKRVSLEKFECGSWRSAAIANSESEDGFDDTSGSLFFDLPLELIKSDVNDAVAPVTAAFVFDNKQDTRGVLKNVSSRASTARKSHESPRHVRFSSASPTLLPSSPSISPRLHRAREEFNAFLQAQSA